MSVGDAQDERGHAITGAGQREIVQSHVQITLRFGVDSFDPVEEIARTPWGEGERPATTTAQLLLDFEHRLRVGYDCQTKMNTEEIR